MYLSYNYMQRKTSKQNQNVPILITNENRIKIKFTDKQIKDLKRDTIIQIKQQMIIVINSIILKKDTYIHT